MQLLSPIEGFYKLGGHVDNTWQQYTNLSWHMILPTSLILVVNFSIISWALTIEEFIDFSIIDLLLGAWYGDAKLILFFDCMSMSVSEICDKFLFI